MKLIALAFTNFKSFGQSKNSVDDQVNGLADVNMVYGYNNSGKSNLLKFIHLFFQTKVIKTVVKVEGERIEAGEDLQFWKGPIKSPFIFHKNQRSNAISFSFTIQLSHDEINKSGFPQYDQLSTLFSHTHENATFTFQGLIQKVDDFDNAEMILQLATINSKKIYSIDPSKRAVYFESIAAKNPLKSDSIAFSNLMSIFNDATLFLDNNRYLIDETMQQKELRLTPLTLKNYLYKLYLNPRTNESFEDLIKFINKNRIYTKNEDSASATFNQAEENSPFIDFKPEFALLEDDIIEIMIRRGPLRIPLSSYGTGIQQLLYVLTALFYSKSRIILIEELELNLSPRYQQELFKILNTLIRDKKIDQVIFTTHSKYFSQRSDFSIYEVTINSEGVSKVTKVTKTRSNLFFKELE